MWNVDHRERLAEARHHVEQSQETLDHATRQRVRTILDALRDGISPTRITEWAGVSRSRVYQIRDTTQQE